MDGGGSNLVACSEPERRERLRLLAGNISFMPNGTLDGFNRVLDFDEHLTQVFRVTAIVFLRQKRRDVATVHNLSISCCDQLLNVLVILSHSGGLLNHAQQNGRNSMAGLVLTIDNSSACRGVVSYDAARGFFDKPWQRGYEVGAKFVRVVRSCLALTELAFCRKIYNPMRTALCITAKIVRPGRFSAPSPTDVLDGSIATNAPAACFARYPQYLEGRREVPVPYVSRQDQNTDLTALNNGLWFW
jgi:hypothetical protein